MKKAKIEKFGLKKASMATLIWHFMRRKAVGCTSESHSLYGTYMSRLPGCVFEWDANDVYNLKEARRANDVLAAEVILNSATWEDVDLTL